jgi:hypothetical protein
MFCVLGLPWQASTEAHLKKKTTLKRVEPLTNFVILSEAKNLVISSGSAAMMIRDVSLRST